MLDYTAGTKCSVQVSGDRYVIENLRIAVTGGVLSIVRPNGLDLPKNETITLTITSPTLSRLQTSGLVHAKLTGLTGRSFLLINNGAEAATLVGSVHQFSIESRGVASIDAGALKASDLTMLVRGQGNFRVFAGESANVRMYGEGKVDVLGHPAAHKFRALAYGVIALK